MPPQKSPLNNLERLQAWQATEAAWRTFIPLVPIVTGLPAFDGALDGGLNGARFTRYLGMKAAERQLWGCFSLAAYRNREVSVPGLMLIIAWMLVMLLYAACSRIVFGFLERPTLNKEWRFWKDWLPAVLSIGWCWIR